MRKFWVGLMALMVSASLFAAPRTMEEAAEIAAQFTNQQPKLRMMHKTPRTASTMCLAHKALQNNSEAAAFYIFNQEGGNGFVIVSADDRTAEDVLGYTENGAFDVNTINPNLKWWLSRYAEEITVLQTMDDSEFEPQPRKAKQVTAIANLLVNQNGTEITWYQEAPYNNLCPMDQLDNTRSLTGCVATAAAQIMYKWRWPEQGTGSSSYVWQNCTAYNSRGDCTNSTNNTLTANYGQTTYDWDNMLPAYEGKNATTAQENAVATLMYHCGVACEMSYGGDEAGGSGAWTDNMAYGLMTYFDYDIDKFITMYSRSNYGDAHEGVTAEYSVSRDQFKEYFNADLEAGRPILMGGEDSSGGGHEFVCCGRDANNKFYINFGWEGSGDGYYAITSLKPSGSSYNFSNNLDAIIGLRPKQNLPPVTVTWSVNGNTSTTQVVPGNTATPEETPESCQNGKVFVGWTQESDVAGDRPADLFTTGKVVNEATTFYAVFATAEEGSIVPTNDYKKITSTTELEDGNYIVVGFYNSNYYAMKNQLTSNGYYIDQQQVTPASSGMITTTDGNIIWQIALNNNTLSFYNASEGKYVHIYQNNTYTNVGFTTSANGNIHFSFTVSNGSWDFVNTAITGKNHLEYYGLKSDFTAYSSAGDPIYLYKQQIGPSTTYSDYTTVINCGTSAIENQVVILKAVKVIENGQIVIIRDNEKYSILGQKIQ